MTNEMLRGARIARWMSRGLLAAVIALVAGGCANGYGYTTSGYYTSPGVGVYAVSGYDNLYYANHHYWHYDQGLWYRSPYRTHGFIAATPPRAVISYSGHPYRYRYGHYPSYRRHYAPSYRHHDRPRVIHRTYRDRPQRVHPTQRFHRPSRVHGGRPHRVDRPSKGVRTQPRGRVHRADRRRR